MATIVAKIIKIKGAHQKSCYWSLLRIHMILNVILHTLGSRPSIKSGKEQKQ